MLRCLPNTLMSGLIILADESFLVSTPIKTQGIESEKHTLLCMRFSLCRNHVIDDTWLYTYFIETCIFYCVILGTPLLCSQYVEEPESVRFSFCGSHCISKRKMEKHLRGCQTVVFDKAQMCLHPLVIVVLVIINIRAGKQFKLNQITAMQLWSIHS